MEVVILWAGLVLTALAMLGAVHRFIWGSLLARFAGITDKLKERGEDIDELKESLMAERVSHTEIKAQLKALADMSVYQHQDIGKRFDKTDTDIAALVQNTAEIREDVTHLQHHRATDREFTERIERKAETITDIGLDLAQIREFLEFKSLPKRRRGTRAAPDEKKID